MDRSERWFRRVLRLFPRSFRDRHGEPMVRTFRDELGETRGRGATFALWTSTLAGVLGTAPKEHVRILLHDLRLALRGIGRNALVSVVAVSTLSLGIGATATLFGVVNAILIRPLPFRDDDRLVRIYLSRDGQRPYLSPTNPVLFEDVERMARFHEGIVAQRLRNVTVGTGEGPERVGAMGVTKGWLAILGVEPVLGRGFTAEEDEVGEDARVVLVSYRFWARRFGSDPMAVGTAELVIDERSFTVVGVLPRGFQYPYENDLWTPLDLKRNREGLWGLNIQARLKPGVTVEEARAELVVVADAIEQSDHDLLRGMELIAVPIREVLLDEREGYVVFLLGAVGLVLLLVSVNIGNLLLARGHSRQGEMALRSALGASRFRQARQLLTESLALTALGGGGGLFLASALRGFASALIPGRMAFVLDRVAIDGRVLLFTLGLTVLVGLVFGCAPAIKFTGGELSRALKTGKALDARGSRNLSVALVVGELALALVVVNAAGMLVGHYASLYRAELGYDPSRLALATVPLDEAPYLEPERRTTFVEASLARIETLPKVSAAGATCIFPSAGANFLIEVAIEGRPQEPERGITLNHRFVTRGFFDALGIGARRGRLFTDADRRDAAPVAVLSERGAARYFPGVDPVGKRLRSLRRPDDPWMTIVGVVPDLREFDRVEQTLYVPFAQGASSSQTGQAIFVVATETGTSPEQILGPLRAALSEIDPALPVFDMRTAEELYRESLDDERLSAILSASFAAFALLTAGLGVFGVMAYAVSRRTRELGLRAALGARPRDILLGILEEGTSWTLGGIALGTIASLLAARLLVTLVPGLEAPGVLVFGGLAAVLAIVGIASSVVPARRALAVDPLTALRSE
jgi:putative ABC transport system permease protein